MSTHRASAPIHITIPLDLSLHDLSMVRIGFRVMVDGLTDRGGGSDDLIGIIMPVIDRLTDIIQTRPPQSMTDMAVQIICVVDHYRAEHDEALDRLRSHALHIIAEKETDDAII